MESQTLFPLALAITALIAVLLACIVAAFAAGQHNAAKSIRQTLEAADHSQPFLDAVEGGIRNIPPEVVEAFAEKLLAAFALGRTLATTDDARAIVDALTDITKRVTDGKPNEVNEPTETDFLKRLPGQP